MPKTDWRADMTDMTRRGAVVLSLALFLIGAGPGPNFIEERRGSDPYFVELRQPHPGMYLLLNVATVGVSTVKIYHYYAGADGRTLHIYQIKQQEISSRIMPEERLPILLPLGSDDSATLVVYPVGGAK